jgi:hypothetical protein
VNSGAERINPQFDEDVIGPARRPLPGAQAHLQALKTFLILRENFYVFYQLPEVVHALSPLAELLFDNLMRGHQLGQFTLKFWHRLKQGDEEGGAGDDVLQLFLFQVYFY